MEESERQVHASTHTSQWMSGVRVCISTQYALPVCNILISGCVTGDADSDDDDDDDGEWQSSPLDITF